MEKTEGRSIGFGLMIPRYPFYARLSIDNTLVQGMPWWIVSKYCGGPGDDWQAVASNKFQRVFEPSFRFLLLSLEVYVP
jgi:hypothetical protein